MDRLVIALVFVATALTGTDSAAYSEPVETTYGVLQGIEIDKEDLHFNAFLGIPYAAPPVKELRFQDPQPPEKWQGTRRASSYGSVCPQIIHESQVKMDFMKKVRLFFSNALNIAKTMVKLFQQSEDCLTLNVYTKKLGAAGLPVLVWIHGGGYYMGDGTDTNFGPDYLVDQDIVVVTFNYRLGALGFLATNTSDAPGNWGLKDQVAVLRWVQDNIANFGGDPKQVTIYGQSSGGSSVHFHLLSPLSKGLFHRAIASSGTATCDDAYTVEQERFSQNLAAAVGGSEDEVEDPSRRVQFLRTVDARKLVDHYWDVLEDEDREEVNIPLPFGPVVEPPDVENAFITELPEDLLSEGKFSQVPLMMGFNDLEGGQIFTVSSRYGSSKAIAELNEDACAILPFDLREAVNASNACATFTQELRESYFGGKPIGSDELKYVYLVGDSTIIHYTYQAVNFHAHYASAESPVYHYCFAFDGEWNALKKLLGVTFPGALQGEDTNYLFKTKAYSLPSLEPGSATEITHKRMVGFIANFVKSGNPTPATSELMPVLWKPTTKDERYTMRIDNDLTLEKDYLGDRMDFWDQLYEKYLP